MKKVFYHVRVIFALKLFFPLMPQVKQIDRERLCKVTQSAIN